MDWFVNWFGNPYQNNMWYEYPDYGYDYNQENSLNSYPINDRMGINTYWSMDNGMNYIQPQQYFNNYADMYSQSNPQLSQQYSNLANQAGMWWDTQRSILWWYDQLANDAAMRQQGVTDTSVSLANNLLGDINSQRDYVYSMYWPNGEITNMVNDYYSGLQNAISWDTGRQLAQNDVNAATAGLSLGANRNTQNEIYNEGYERALKAREADINAKQNIIKQLQDYMTNLRKEYGDTTNQYVIEKYQKAADLINQIQSSMTQEMTQVDLSKLNYLQQLGLMNAQAALSWSGTTSSNENLKVDADGNPIELSADQQTIVNSYMKDLVDLWENPTKEQLKVLDDKYASYWIPNASSSWTITRLLPFATNMSGSSLNTSWTNIVNMPNYLSGDTLTYPINFSGGNYVYGNTWTQFNTWTTLSPLFNKSK